MVHFKESILLLIIKYCYNLTQKFQSALKVILRLTYCPFTAHRPVTAYVVRVTAVEHNV